MSGVRLSQTPPFSKIALSGNGGGDFVFKGCAPSHPPGRRHPNPNPGPGGTRNRGLAGPPPSRLPSRPGPVGVGCGWRWWSGPGNTSRPPAPAPWPRASRRRGRFSGIQGIPCTWAPRRPASTHCGEAPRGFQNFLQFSSSNHVMLPPDATLLKFTSKPVLAAVRICESTWPTTCVLPP